MANPGWYISDPAAVVTLPVCPIWETPLKDVSETDIVHETIRGEKHVFKLVKRRQLRYIFHVSANDLDTYFRALHDAVEGQLTPFYFVPNTAVMGTVILVRKEAEFRPVPAAPARFGGNLVQWYTYTLELEEQKPPVEIIS